MTATTTPLLQILCYVLWLCYDFKCYEGVTTGIRFSENLGRAYGIEGKQSGLHSM